MKKAALTCSSSSTVCDMILPASNAGKMQGTAVFSPLSYVGTCCKDDSLLRPRSHPPYSLSITRLVSRDLYITRSYEKFLCRSILATVPYASYHSTEEKCSSVAFCSLRQGSCRQRSKLIRISLRSKEGFGCLCFSQKTAEARRTTSTLGLDPTVLKTQLTLGTGFCEQIFCPKGNPLTPIEACNLRRPDYPTNPIAFLVLGASSKSPIFFSLPTIYRPRCSISSIYGVLGSALSSFGAASQITFPPTVQVYHALCREICTSLEVTKSFSAVAYQQLFLTPSTIPQRKNAAPQLFAPLSRVHAVKDPS